MSVAAKLNGPGPKGRLFLHQHEVIKCLVSLPQVVPKFYSFVCNPSFPLFANLWLVNLINPKTPSLVLTVANLRIFSTLSSFMCFLAPLPGHYFLHRIIKSKFASTYPTFLVWIFHHEAIHCLWILIL